MPSKKSYGSKGKSKSPKKPAARKHKGSVGTMNKNQRKQLEALGYTDKPKGRKR